MLLALYIYVPPRRNKDYQFMNVVKKYNDSLDDDINYLSYEDNRFIFNVYKTSKKYGKQIIEINPDLKACIDIYLKFHPKILGKITKKHMSVAKKHIQNRILDRDKVTSSCVSNLVEAVIGGLLLWIGPWSQRSHPRLNTRPVRSGLGEGT